jgi:rubrerythrin
MDTLEFAKSLEKEGKEFYEKCAKDSPFKELAGIFLVLAKEEQRHFDLFTALQKKQVLPPTTDISSSKEAKKVFAGLSKNFSFPDDVYSYTETYEKALDIERNSILLYEDMLAKATSVE